MMHLADLAPGMTVADIGAGEGYYTVRLAPLVGKKGRCSPRTSCRRRATSSPTGSSGENLDNVAVRARQARTTRCLPEHSFDRIFMIHMYHEVGEPTRIPVAPARRR